MQCAHCKREADCKLAHMKPYCKHCFCEVIEKRVRKDLRIKFKIKAHEHIVLIQDNSKEAVVGEYILNSIAKKIPLKIEKVDSIDKLTLEQKEARIIIPLSASKLAAEFISTVFRGTKETKEQSNIIPFLSSVSESEIITFAQFRNLKYKEEPQSTKNDMKKVLDQIEQHYGGSTFGIIKSREVLEETKKNN